MQKVEKLAYIFLAEELTIFDGLAGGKIDEKLQSFYLFLCRNKLAIENFYRIYVRDEGENGYLGMEYADDSIFSVFLVGEEIFLDDIVAVGKELRIADDVAVESCDCLSC
jgi:hypothetical protein